MFTYTDRYLTEIQDVTTYIMFVDIKNEIAVELPQAIQANGQVVIYIAVLQKKKMKIWKTGITPCPEPHLWNFK